MIVFEVNATSIMKNYGKKIKTRWSVNFLKQYRLDDLESETGWLQNIFRKHRKSFSYLEHIIAIEALLNSEWTFADILNRLRVSIQNPK